MHQQLAVQASGSVIPFQSATLRAYMRLQSWDLTNVKTRLIKDGEYKPEEIDEVETEYKKYLALCIGHPRKGFPTPLRLDPMWHAQILFTRDYAAMCKLVAGYFLHHSPFVGDEKPSPEGRVALHELYEREFGDKPGPLWGRSADCCEPCCGSIDTVKAGGLCCNGCAHVKDASCSGPCNGCGDISAAKTAEANCCKRVRDDTGSWTMHAGLCQSQCDSKCGPCKSA